MPGPLENTLEGIQAASALGADGVEIDLRLSSACEILLKHDPLDPSDHLLTRLADVLGASPGIELDLEVKGPIEDVSQFVSALRDLDLDPQTVFVSSFWLPVLIEIRLAIPQLRLGVLTSAVFDPDGGTAIDLATSHGFEIVVLEHPSVSIATLGRAAERGLEVVVWTVNEASRIVQLSDWGADVIVTDEVALAKSLVV